MRRKLQGPPSHWITGWVPGMPSRFIDLDFHIPALLHRAAMAATQRILPALHPRGLTEPQWRLLRVLETAGLSLTMKEIEGVSGLQDRSVRHMARILGSRGLTRWRDRPDAVRRGNSVQPGGRWLGIEPAGRETIWRVQRALRAAFVDPAPRFGRRESARLDRCLSELTRTAGLILPPRRLPPLVPSSFYPALDDPAGWNAEAIHDLDLGLPLRVRLVRLALVARLRPILKRHDLSEPQWRCLRIFEFFVNPINSTAVTRAGCFQPGAGNRHVDMLLERGLIEYDLHPRLTTHNRPRKRFKLLISRGGRRLIERVEADESRLLGDVRERLTADAVGELQSLLSRLTGALLWTPDFDGEEPAFHPLYALYVQTDRRALLALREKRAKARNGAVAMYGLPDQAPRSP